MLAEWLELDPEWLEVAQHQNPDKKEEELSKEVLIDKPNDMYWALLGIYKHVDVFKWFVSKVIGGFPLFHCLHAFIPAKSRFLRFKKECYFY